MAMRQVVDTIGEIGCRTGLVCLAEGARYSVSGAPSDLAAEVIRGSLPTLDLPGYSA